MFDLDDRLQLLAERLARHEAPDKTSDREATQATTRRSLLPAERRANVDADRAVSQLKDEERGPKGVHRDRTLVDAPGSAGVDPQAWKRVISEQDVTASPMPPDVAARFQDKMPEDVSEYHFHTDGAADEICRLAQSEVVARGKDIFFRRGTPMPGTEKGDRLLAEAMAQLSVDARTAEGEQPMRRFVDQEPPDLQRPEEEVENDPKSSGLGLLGLVGAVSAVKEAHDRRKEAKSATADAELQRQRSETEQRAKAAQETAANSELTKDLQQDSAAKDQDAAAKAQTTSPTVDATPDVAELDPADKSKATRLLEEMRQGAEHQLDHQGELPEGTSELVEDRKEGLALFAGAAAQMLDGVRKADADATSAPESVNDDKESTGRVDLELGLDRPFQVQGNYGARWNQAENNTDPGQVDVQDHQLLLGTEVPDAAREFEENAFGADLSTTVERIVDNIETQLTSERTSSTDPHEQQRLSQDLDKQRPQLASVIEERVREAADKNGAQDERAEEELQLDLEAEQGEQQSETTTGEDTFAFGARIDLTTGEVVVTTQDAIPTSAEAAPAVAAPGLAGGGGDGGGGAGGGAGAGGGGGGGGGAV